MSKDLE